MIPWESAFLLLLATTNILWVFSILTASQQNVVNESSQISKSCQSSISDPIMTTFQNIQIPQPSCVLRSSAAGGGTLEKAQFGPFGKIDDEDDLKLWVGLIPAP